VLLFTSSGNFQNQYDTIFNSEKIPTPDTVCICLLLRYSFAVEMIATELDQGQNADIFNFTSHVYVLCKNRVRIGGFVHAPASLKVVISAPGELCNNMK
jgi:hypothetical protein